MFIRLVLLALILACTDFPTVPAREIKCIVRERRALMRFKQGLIDEYGLLSSWGSGAECCKWEGVRCSNTSGHVTGILLQGYDGYKYSPIRGEISSSLLELQFLDYLDLSYNDFGGIPIPRFFGSLENLRILNLQRSSFFGMVPPQLGNLTNLCRLDLSSNIIWSENLDWLSHLTSLSQLNLIGANISDSNWLYSVFKLLSLQQLSLYSCSLKDATPSSDLFLNSSLLQSLSVLNLSDNMLTSSAFDWLFNLSTTLVNINLSFNLLDGPIPDSFGRFSFLEELDLSSNKLTGGVPKILGSLRHLKYLYLSSNHFVESLEGLFGIFDSCKVMISLQEVNLFSNQIKGPIPEEVGACSKLKYLDVGNNKLTGLVPSSLGNLSKLQYLSFTLNSLEGVVSESHFLKLHSLKYLDLSYNSLTLHITPSWIPPFQLDEIRLASCNMGASFPAWLQTQTKFFYLDISSASISDKVPEWLWSLSPKVDYFNISNNELFGPVPDLSFSRIDEIYASHNQLSGLVPLLHPSTSFVQFSNNFFSDSISSICSVSYNNLLLLDLSNNRLVGALPNCWENMTYLMILNLSNNKLSGEIPASLGSLFNLIALHLRGNILSGVLPSSLQNCGFLQLIDIGDNNLTGEIPLWLNSSFYSSMMYISLCRNGFHGRIPQEICSLNQIQLLDLSRNNISGNLPHCFHNFTSLVDQSNVGITTSSMMGLPFRSGSLAAIVDDAIVQWKSQEEVYSRLGLLKLIDLSSNKLVGNIPTSFSYLRGLISLNLSRNDLSGSIDSHIGQMEMLEVLDLSRNQLSGEIPIGLAQLHYLDVLDLADNKLSGKIPSGTQLQSFNESAYAGNDKLCGLPLKLCETDTDSGGERSDEQKDDGGSTGLSFMQEFGISMAFGFSIGFWGAVGSFIVKKSWRDAFFGSLDSLTKFKQR